MNTYYIHAEAWEIQRDGKWHKEPNPCYHFSRLYSVKEHCENDLHKGQSSGCPIERGLYKNRVVFEISTAAQPRMLP